LKAAKMEKLQRRGGKGDECRCLSESGVQMVDGIGQKSQLAGKETRNEIDRLYIGVRNKFSCWTVRAESLANGSGDCRRSAEQRRVSNAAEDSQQQGESLVGFHGGKLGVE
jgi:hypothetical protein